MRGNGMSMTIEKSNRWAILRVTQAIAAVILLVAAAQASAGDLKPASLNVMGHPVHQRAATGSAGNITAEWSKTSGVGVTWLTFDIGPLFERLFTARVMDSLRIPVMLRSDREALSVALKTQPRDAGTGLRSAHPEHEGAPFDRRLRILSP